MIAAACALLLAAAPSPRSLPRADFAVHVPRLEQASSLRPFLERAGERAVLARPQSWQSEFHPLLSVNPLSAESLRAAGIDPAGAATVSARGQVRLSCVALVDPTLHEERLRARLATLGAPWKQRSFGIWLHGAQAGGKLVAAYALRGTEACAISATALSPAEAAEAARALSRPSPEWKGALAAKGPVKVLAGQGYAGLSGDARSMTAEGRLALSALPSLRGAGATPYGNLSLPQLALIRARVDPLALEGVLLGIAQRVLPLCPACSADPLAQLARALGPALSGNMVLAVDRVKVSQSLRSATGRFFALRFAALAELSRPEEARGALAALGGWKNARAVEDGYAVSLGSGELWIGVRKAHLYFGDDEQALRSLWAALPPTAGRQAHGVEVRVDPRRVAQGLSQIPLLDVLGSQELAALFAVATELGPLLSVSEELAGWLDPAGAGTTAFHASWLLPERAAPDAGP